MLGWIRKIPKTLICMGGDGSTDDFAYQDLCPGFCPKILNPDLHRGPKS